MVVKQHFSEVEVFAIVPVKRIQAMSSHAK